MSRFVLALDQGTTSSRAIVFDRHGRAAAVAQQEFPQHYPHPGWVEHDPLDLWESTRRTALGAVAEANLTARDLAAVGLTNQRETTLLWDRRTGRPLHRAIVWQDRRTADLCAKLKRRGLEPFFRKKTGLLLDPYFSGTKLAWLLDRVPGARRRAERGELAFGTVDTWLLWQLTGGRVHATDVSNASRTLLLDLRTGDWDDALLRALRIPREVLPEVRASSGIFGEISAVPALNGIPISGVAGDQQAALFGQACWRPGMAKNTYGTGCFLLLHTGRQPVASKNHLLTTIAWKIDGRLEYALEGSVFIGGAVVQWLRDGLGLIAKSVDVEKLAARVTDNGGIYLVPAFAGLGAPHWDAAARGIITGLTRGSNAGHLARAALESIAYQSADLLRAMEADAGRKLRELRVDGGAVGNNALMQFQADLLRVPVVRPRTAETTALGAAYLAGLAVGFWKNREEIAALWSADHTFRPRAPAATTRRLLAEWHGAVARAKTSP
ncbi:glycerol kinase GlpK [Opitutus sp. GAS368]|jgi:glycerol kinase|uniref:glycerol kinase GlpK n=1 Tax=Opitutus sp. GAS368 TaxID=1882749 RepID=UPI00087C05C9|nr:glycerol kinase GlpK [Opitutus sp. GAS368]SDS01719.1 glycerol kinase [Opitutus sp. GAS368]